MFLKKLIELIPAPDHPVGIGDFSIIYEKLGIQLPKDYYDFISAYGAGMFGNSLEVYSPFIENEYVNLFDRIEALRDSYETMKKIWNDMNMNDVFPNGAGYPFGFYPDKEGLLPWGCIEGCGIYFYWKTGKPKWEIVAYNDDDYQIYQMSMTEFIFNVFSSKIDFFGLSDIVEEDLCFTSYH